MENIQNVATQSNDPVTDALLKQTNTILNTSNAQLVETNTTLEENTPTSTNNGGSY